MLEDPPILQRMLLEQPLPVISALGVVAAVMLVMAQRRRRRLLAMIGVAAIVLASAVAVLSATVTTGRESLIQRASLLIKATAPLDEPALRTLFMPEIQLTVSTGANNYRADQILERLASVLKRFRIQGHKTLKLDVRAGANVGRMILQIRTYLPSQEHPAPPHSTWQIDWRLGPYGVWRIIEIRWLKFEGREPTLYIREAVGL